MSVLKDELPNKAQINTSMEDRLLRAAEHLNKQLFEQFNAPYIDVAHNIVKAITRGGDPIL